MFTKKQLGDRSGHDFACNVASTLSFLLEMKLKTKIADLTLYLPLVEFLLLNNMLLALFMSVPRNQVGNPHITRNTIMRPFFRLHSI